ncbi:transcriptional regulator [Malaciobacter molluscorum LMG 25693]|uniref:Transcriptional regulator n=1 Tax=Malaciobacter molluscorum LMG 25693 TaxID=870501 RepID=A0A2G1DKI7_9BACT|nr:Crp/Fnr family transcriptional regulator [Malaciobacter molluscorum]AXX91427.1 transcriptional regulator, Crp/Fnr family [Malaciobacter molluscorum LMG 25693]PHO18826.1 transcriptional regulator [Malaciobacter molluscorum LMG 25693]
MNLQETIKSIDFFNSLTAEQIDILCDFSNITSYEKDSILYYESDENNKLMFLIDGLLKVFKVDKFGNEIFLYHIYKNNMISELSSINNTKIHCFSNAEFIEDSKVLSVNYEKFKENFLDKNILTSELIEVLLNKSQQFQCIINRELVFDATAKVAFMLKQDLHMFNKLKRQEVSFMLHIQPETLSRVLKRLTRNNIINIENGDVQIIDENSLVSIFKGIGV